MIYAITIKETGTRFCMEEKEDGKGKFWLMTHKPEDSHEVRYYYFSAINKIAGKEDYWKISCEIALHGENEGDGGE